MAPRARATSALQREILIESHMGAVRQMARRTARRLPRSIPAEDVESAALLGLIEAASRYDPTRPEPFMAFAVKRVRGAMADYLRGSDFMSRPHRQKARRVNRAIRRLEAELGRAVADDEVAAALGVSDAEYQGGYAHLPEVAVVRLDELRHGLGSAHGTQPGWLHERQQEKATLVRALKRLDERSVTVLGCYYAAGCTLREIGALLGVSESRVCQIHTQALRDLRRYLAA